MTKQLKQLKVYIVHQFAYNEDLDCDYGIDTVLNEHKILGVYLNRDDAECHRHKLICKNSSKYFSGESPYIAVTKHTVRGKNSKLLAIFTTKGWNISAKGHKLFDAEDFV